MGEKNRYPMKEKVSEGIHETMLAPLGASGMFAGNSVYTDTGDRRTEPGNCSRRRPDCGAQMGGCLGCQLPAHNDKWGAASCPDIPKSDIALEHIH
jgi:hypothetical protein